MSDNKETTKDHTAWKFRDWYRKNAETLSTRRKGRYHEDEDYRKHVLEQNREYRQRKAMERKISPRVQMRVHRNRRPVIVQAPISGVMTPVEFFYVGTFANRIEKSPSTVRMWERAGILPRTPFVIQTKKRKERLYTESMALAVLPIISEYNEIPVSKGDDVSAAIKKAWKSQGIDVDTEFAIGLGVKNGKKSAGNRGNGNGTNGGTKPKSTTTRKDTPHS